MNYLNGLLLILVFSLSAFSQQEEKHKHSTLTSDKHVMVTPDSIKWDKQMVVLSGSPNIEGAPFVIRLKFSDGAKIPPHWHLFDENITVIKGTLFMGLGEEFDVTKAQEMPVGSYEFITKEIRHFGWVKGETIIQIHGIGPFKTFWVETKKQANKQN